MGYKSDCKKALKVGSRVMINFFGTEYSGAVVSYDSANSSDYGATVEMDDGVRMIFPLSHGGVAVAYAPTAESIKKEKNPKKKVEVDKNGESRPL